MIKGNIKISINTSEIDKLKEEMQDALVETMGILHDRIREEQVIPRDLGALQGIKFYVDDSRKDEGIVSLVNEGPYARRLYYHPEYNFQTTSWVDANGVQHGGNRNAQGMWFSLWQRGGYYENEPQEIFERVMKK